MGAGSVDPSSPLCPPSNRCGSPSRNTTSLAHPSSTASASKSRLFFLQKKDNQNIETLQAFRQLACAEKKQHPLLKRLHTFSACLFFRTLKTLSKFLLLLKL